jgi:hypothetical protein
MYGTGRAVAPSIQVSGRAPVSAGPRRGNWLRYSRNSRCSDTPISPESCGRCASDRDGCYSAGGHPPEIQFDPFYQRGLPRYTSITCIAAVRPASTSRGAKAMPRKSPPKPLRRLLPDINQCTTHLAPNRWSRLATAERYLQSLRRPRGIVPETHGGAQPCTSVRTSGHSSE